MIKQLTAGTLAGWGASWLSGCEDPDALPGQSTYDERVVVIGAGAAGLYAADILKSKGFQVMVLEASDRVGGRIHSLKTTDIPSESLFFGAGYLPSRNYPIELGAQFIYGADSLWGQIAVKRNAPLVDIRAAQPKDGFILDQQLQSQSAVETDADFIAASQFLESLKSYNGANISVQDLAAAQNLDARIYPILNSWIGNSSGTDNDRLSALAIAERESLLAHTTTLLTTSTHPMQDILYSRFDAASKLVRTNAAVTHIRYSDATIQVELVGGEIVEADRVIVTVPISVLKAGDIVFSPSLPSAKSAALSRLGMDACVRVSIEFIKNVWLEEAAFLQGGSVAPSYNSSAVGRKDLNKFMDITVFGAAAEQLSAQGTNMVDTILAEMDATMGGDAASAVAKDAFGNRKVVIKDWSKDPFIKGGISYTKPGGSNADRAELAAPVGNKLFFAGEATDVLGDFGTVTGALQSAERAAQEVIDSVS
jgi:monoamine oxidase